MAALPPAAAPAPSTATTASVAATLTQGSTFPSKEAAITAISQHVLLSSRNYIIARSSNTRLEVFCAVPPVPATKATTVAVASPSPTAAAAELDAPSPTTAAFALPSKKRGRPAKMRNTTCSFHITLYCQLSGVWHVTLFVPHNCPPTAIQVCPYAVCLLFSTCSHLHCSFQFLAATSETSSPSCPPQARRLSLMLS